MITNNERIALNQIALNLYQPQNGARPESFDDTSAIWSNCLDSTNASETLKGRTLSATCASLAKKGLITTYDAPRRRGTNADESTLTLTQEGYDAWREAFPSVAPSHPACVTVTTVQGLKVDINFDRTADVCWSCDLRGDVLRERSLERIMTAIAEYIGRTEF